MFHVLAALIAVYVLWRLVWCRNWSRGVKVGLSLLILLASQHHLITRTFFGSMASPELPGGVIMTTGWAFGSILLAGCLLALFDAAGLVAGLVSRPLGRRWLGNVGLRSGLAVAAMALAAFGVREAVRVPDVRTVEITVPGLAPALEGFRLVQLTDLHASRLLQAPWIEAVVDKTNALRPDLIVITGDLADGSVANRAADVEPLRRLSAPQGVYAIPGNHEYYTEYQAWLERLRELDLRVLLNEHVVLEPEGGPLVLAGLTDPAAARFGQPLPDVRAALANAPAGVPVILLNHRPTGASEHAAAGARLQLSGHTHGGQIAGLHWITQLANEGLVSGYYDVDGMGLYVSHGAGLWNGLPLRVGRPSEITEIILRAG